MLKLLYILLFQVDLFQVVDLGQIFNLATEGLGKYSAAASGIFMMMVVGGGVLPLLQNFIADNIGYMLSYIIPFIGIAYLSRR